MNSKVLNKIFCFMCIFVLFNFVNGQEVTSKNNIENVSEEITNEAKKSISEGLDLDDYVSSIDEYVKKSGIDNIDVKEITDELMKGSNLDYKKLVFKILSLFSNEITNSITSAITIFIIIIIMAVISSLELEEKSDVTKIAHIVCFLTLATITISNFIDVITSFKNTVSTLSMLMQVISPFLMGVLLATGSISSTGIVQPMVLFIASAVGFIITYIVIPFLSISVAFNVISSISENLKLNRLSKLFTSSSLWIVGIVFTVFLGILSLESSFTSSVDALAVKTTQAAVSNFVPVVGKFFSDSFETVVGATKVISNVGGIIGIIAIVIVAIVPILKILCVLLVYIILSALIEPICDDANISKYISGFVNIYKTILGVLIGVSILFIISTGITLNLVGQVVK